MSAICRTCLLSITNGAEYFNINVTEPDSSSLSIKPKLEACVPELTLDVVKDAVLCITCVADLCTAYEFKQKCLKSEETIYNYIARSEANPDSIDIERVVKWSNKFDEYIAKNIQEPPASKDRPDSNDAIQKTLNKSIVENALDNEIGLNNAISVGRMQKRLNALFNRDVNGTVSIRSSSAETLGHVQLVGDRSENNNTKRIETNSTTSKHKAGSAAALMLNMFRAGAKTVNGDKYMCVTNEDDDAIGFRETSTDANKNHRAECLSTPVVAEQSSDDVEFVRTWGADDGTTSTAEEVINQTDHEDDSDEIEISPIASAYKDFEFVNVDEDGPIEEFQDDQVESCSENSNDVEFVSVTNKNCETAKNGTSSTDKSGSAAPLESSSKNSNVIELECVINNDTRTTYPEKVFIVNGSLPTPVWKNTNTSTLSCPETSNGVKFVATANGKQVKLVSSRKAKKNTILNFRNTSYLKFLKKVRPPNAVPGQKVTVRPYSKSSRVKIVSLKNATETLFPSQYATDPRYDFTVRESPSFTQPPSCTNSSRDTSDVVIVEDEPTNVTSDFTVRESTSFTQPPSSTMSSRDTSDVVIVEDEPANVTSDLTVSESTSFTQPPSCTMSSRDTSDVVIVEDEPANVTTDLTVSESPSFTQPPSSTMSSRDTSYVVIVEDKPANVTSDFTVHKSPSFTQPPSSAVSSGDTLDVVIVEDEPKIIEATDFTVSESPLFTQPPSSAVSSGDKTSDVIANVPERIQSRHNSNVSSAFEDSSIFEDDCEMEEETVSDSDVIMPIIRDVIAGFEDDAPWDLIENDAGVPDESQASSQEMDVEEVPIVTNGDNDTIKNPIGRKKLLSNKKIYKTLAERSTSTSNVDVGNVSITSTINLGQNIEFNADVGNVRKLPTTSCSSIDLTISPKSTTDGAHTPLAQNIEFNADVGNVRKVSATPSSSTNRTISFEPTVFDGIRLSSNQPNPEITSQHSQNNNKGVPQYLLCKLLSANVTPVEICWNTAGTQNSTDNPQAAYDEFNYNNVTIKQEPHFLDDINKIENEIDVETTSLNNSNVISGFCCSLQEHSKFERQFAEYTIDDFYKNGLFSLPECSVVLNHLSEEELQRWSRDEIYTCELCDFSCESLSLKMAHETAHRRMIYRCHSCKFHTKYKTYLIRHVRTHSQRYRNKQKEKSSGKYSKNFKCSKCNYSSRYESSLLFHLRIHYEEPSGSAADAETKVHSCGSCNFKATYRYMLKDHMKSHKEKEFYQCGWCYYHTTDKESLELHIQLHYTTRYKCTECVFSTNLKKDMKEHYDTTVEFHFDCEPFMCPLCKQCYSTRSKLVAHVLNHYETNKFVEHNYALV